MGNDRSKSDPKVLSEKQLQLLLHKTNLSKEEILDWHNEFIVSSYNLINPPRKKEKSEFE